VSWEDEVAELQARITAVRDSIEAPTHELLRVPPIVEFVLSHEFLEKKTLFPRQATLLRAVFLDVESMTDYDRAVLAEWSEGFVPGRYDELFDGRWYEPAPGQEFTIGTPPDLFDRIQLMKERGRRWFKHVNMVAGRRAGKGEVTSMGVAYAIWSLLALDEPQLHVHAATGKVLTVDVYAGNAQQARENVFADVVRTVVSAPCFAPFVQSLTRDKLVLATPFDRRDPNRVRTGTIEVVARETTELAARGQSSVVQVFDEMAFVDPASSKTPADALYESASPGLDQARGWGLVFTVSSPKQRANKFYDLHREATEIDMVTGTAAYPEMVTFQFASWSLYLDADDATSIPLASPFVAHPAPWFAGEADSIACFPANHGAPVVDDAELRQRQRRNPRAFRVENGGQWNEAADAFLEPQWVDSLFRAVDGLTLARQHRRRPGIEYVMHVDPSSRHDPTAYVIAHAESTPAGRDVVIDLIRRWVPTGEDLDWDEIYDQIEADVVAFAPRSITVDQHGGLFVVTEIKRRIRELQLLRRIDVREVPHTREGNRSMGDVFRAALRRDRVRSYPDRQLELELRFLQDVNGRPKAPTAGPVRTDDAAIAVMVVAHELLGEDNDAHERLSGLSLRGSPGLDTTQALFDRFYADKRRAVTYRNPAWPRRPPPGRTCR